MIIIGGSHAGISAALRAKECNSSSRVTVLVADSFPNYSICGLPFFLSGEVPDWRTLAHRTIEEIEREGIHLRLNHRAIRIDPAKKMVTVMDNEQPSHPIEYDKIITLSELKDMARKDYSPSHPEWDLEVASVFEIQLRMERGVDTTDLSRFARQVSICCNFRSDSILLVSGMTRVAGIPNLAQLDIDRFDVTGTGDFL